MLYQSLANLIPLIFFFFLLFAVLLMGSYIRDKASNISCTTYKLCIIMHAGVDNKASPNHAILCRTQGMMDL